jgi:hypothetical protein
VLYDYLLYLSLLAPLLALPALLFMVRVEHWASEGGPRRGSSSSLGHHESSLQRRS